MSYTIKDSGLPITVRATFLDKKGAEDTAGTVAFSVDDSTVISVLDNGDRTAVLTPGIAGKAVVSAVKTDPDGATTPATDLNIDVTPGDAVSGTIIVAADPNVVPVADPNPPAVDPIPPTGV